MGKNCLNKATVAVGEFHLCQQCAERPIFRRYRQRVAADEQVVAEQPQPTPK